jgi:DNA-binding CsgD family transcriptional regulator
MLAPTLTPEMRKKLKSLNAEQIVVLHRWSTGISPETIAETWSLTPQRVASTISSIKKLLGPNAVLIYQQYCESLGFTSEKSPKRRSRKAGTRKPGLGYRTVGDLMD